MNCAAEDTAGIKNASSRGLNSEENPIDEAWEDRVIELNFIK